MLVFIARLQRFDMALMEAALDLGATHAQAFRKILLPFLRPAIFSAAVLAFLASFENYNTTVFTISHYNTFTTEIAQKVRLGIDPSVSAVAFVIIVLTLIGALANEGWTRYAEKRLKTGRRGVAAFFRGNPAAILSVMVIAASAATLWFAQVHSAAACKAEVLRQKQEFQRQLEEQRAKERQQAPAIGATETGPDRSSKTLGPGIYGDVFKPANKTPAPAPAPAPPKPGQGSSFQSPGQGAFGNVFAPGNLQPKTNGGQ
jgi:spermidine/putrescine transport system permease protein